MVCIVSKLFWDFFFFLIFTRPLSRPTHVVGAALVYTSSSHLRRKDVIIISCGLGMRERCVECMRNPFVLAFHDGINKSSESQKRPRLHV